MADEPVSACREPAPARLARWGRRHRTLVAGLAASLLVAVLALAFGTILIGRQRSEALRQRDRAAGNLALARQIVDEMYTQVASNLTDRTGMDADQRDLLLKAARFYERFALPQSSDPAVRLEAGRAGLREGEILDKLGQTGPAEEAYGRALRLLDAVAAADPTTAESRRALADGHYQLADLYRKLGKKAEAEASLRLAAATRAPGDCRPGGRRAAEGCRDGPHRAGEYRERPGPARRRRELLSAGHRPTRGPHARPPGGH